MAKQFTEEFLRKAWGSEKSIIYKGKKYRAGRMSYGDYFFEPLTSKRGETEGFDSGTLWLEKKVIKNKYGINQIVYEVTD